MMIQRVRAAFWRATRKQIGTVTAACTILGCNADVPPDDVLPTMAFTDAFFLVDSLELEQAPNLPIVSIESLDVSPQGQVLVTDGPEARVSLFSASGELLQVFGGRGEGAGEFEYPAHARFDKSGDVHVLDIQRRWIAIFSPSSGWQRNLQLPLGLVPHGMEVIENGYWIPGAMLTRTEDEEDMLFKIDTLGVITTKHLRLANARPSGERNHPRWMSIRIASITMGERGPYMSLSLLDSI